MSRGDMKDLGETLEEGDAALVVVGESRIKEAIAKEAKRANRMMEKEIDADAEDLRKQLDAAVDETLGDDIAAAARSPIGRTARQ